MYSRRLAITAGLGLLGLILALACAQAATSSQGGPVEPAGQDEWTPLGGPAVEGGQVDALAVHQDISNTVYAAVTPPDTFASGPSTIYKTTDGAALWEPVFVAEYQVYALAAAGTHVYAGAFNPGGEGTSIYVSGDGGLGWTPAYSFTQRGVLLDACVHPSDDETALLGGWLDDGTNHDQAMVYRTVDGGLTWTPVLTVAAPGENRHVYGVLYHPVTPTIALAAVRVYATNSSVIYRSDDGGTTWPISSTIPDANVISLAANSATPSLIYAGSGSNMFHWNAPNRVYRSPDAGMTWDQVSTEAGGLIVTEPPGSVYALGDNGFWGSLSNGEPGSWTLLQGFWPGPQITLDIDLGATPTALYVGGGWSGMSKGTDGGTLWQQVNNGIETLVTARDIAVDPQDLDKFFVAAECQSGWVTTDGGASWTIPDGLGDCIMSVAVNPADSSIVYAGTIGVETVRRSDDGGLTFTPVYTAPYIDPDNPQGQQLILDVAIAETMPDTVYAAGYDHPEGQDRSAVIVRSLDDGVSWSEVLTQPVGMIWTLAINPHNEAIVYAGGHDCTADPCLGVVHRTVDGGVTWTEVYTGGSAQVRSVVVSHGDPDDVYFADDHYEVYKSEDGGDSWTLIRSNDAPFNTPSGCLLVIDPYVPDHLYLGGWGYIAETTDGGVTWSEWGDPLNSGTPDSQPSALAVDYGTKTQTLYAGFTGVWAHTRVGPLLWQVCLPVVQR